MPPRNIGLAARLFLTITIATLAMGTGFLTLQNMDGTGLNIVIVFLVAYVVMAMAVWTGLSLIFGQRDTGFARSPTVQHLADKSKRGLSSDIYGLLDRMVDKLTPDERAYLKQRLDEAEDNSGDNLTIALENLLADRDQVSWKRQD